jgi:hypothetical protein
MRQPKRRSIRLSRKRLIMTRRENSKAYRSEDRDDQETCAAETSQHP